MGILSPHFPPHQHIRHLGVRSGFLKYDHLATLDLARSMSQDCDVLYAGASAACNVSSAITLGLCQIGSQHCSAKHEQQYLQIR